MSPWWTLVTKHSQQRGSLCVQQRKERVKTKYSSRWLTLIVFLVMALVMGFQYLNRGLSSEIKPAAFTCLDRTQGDVVALPETFSNIYGVGLAYANHINETASTFDVNAGPPIFRKSLSSIAVDGGHVVIPNHGAMLQSIKSVEPDIEHSLRDYDLHLLPLMDHEAELAFVLLEDVDPQKLAQQNYLPKVGFFVANDLSARSVAVLGEGMSNRYEYWGVSKSYPGFTPVSKALWVPRVQLQDAIPCVTLRTHVNGVLKQEERTDNLIYTPVEMLQFIHMQYPQVVFNAGDVVLTGTPGGVIFNVPRWKVRLADIVGIDRFQKLALSQKPSNAARFLEPGDRVTVSAEWLGGVSVELSD